ncbi:MAG: TlpA disulfide reductase family protein [Planctomycetota bacterium]
MTASNRLLRLTAASLLIAAAGHALPQEGMPPPAPQPEAEANANQRGIDIIEACRQALTDADTLVIGVTKSMVKTDELSPENAIFASIQIGARGTVTAARTADNNRVFRIDGTADDIGQPDAIKVTVRRGTSDVSWLDHEASTLVTARPSLARGRELSSENEFGIQYLFGARRANPLRDAIAAPTIEVREPEVVDGVLCDVVSVQYGKPNKSGDQLLFIGKVDSLPRKVHDVLVQGFENRFEFSYEEPETAPTAESLEIALPDGWSTAYRPETLRPGSVDPNEARPLAAGQPGEGTVGFSVGDRAPAFTGLTMLGDEVGTAAIAGKPSLLTFWASWLPDADKLVDLIGSTRSSLGEEVAQVTFVVRERNPDAAFNIMIAEGLEDVPLLIDNRDAALAFGITRVPTIVVIDADGVIRYRADRFDPDRTPGEVEAAIGELVPGE